MPKSTNLGRYPLEYLDMVRYLTEEAEVDKAQMKVSCVDKKAAEAMRFDFYGFQKALVKNDHPLAMQAGRISVRIELDITDLALTKHDLVFEDVTTTGKASNIALALSKARGEAAEIPLTNRAEKEAEARVQETKEKLGLLHKEELQQEDKDVSGHGIPAMYRTGLDGDAND